MKNCGGYVTVCFIKEWNCALGTKSELLKYSDCPKFKYTHILSKDHFMSFKACLTYKLSQDHLELFFSAVRAAGGFNKTKVVDCADFIKPLIIQIDYSPFLKLDEILSPWI